MRLESQVANRPPNRVNSNNSYTIDTFELTRLNPTTALLTYHAAQHTQCNGHAVPSPVWASSLYVRRGGRWLNAMYQQSQALP